MYPYDSGLTRSGWFPSLHLDGHSSLASVGIGWWRLEQLFGAFFQSLKLTLLTFDVTEKLAPAGVRHRARMLPKNSAGASPKM